MWNDITSWFGTLFILWSLSFWVLVGIDVLLLLWFVNLEEIGISTFILLLGLVLLQWPGGLHIFTNISHHPFVVLALIAAYFIIGSIWGIFRWYLLVKKAYTRYEELRRSFCKENSLEYSNPIPESYVVKFRDFIRTEYISIGNSGIVYIREEPPQISSHKARLAVWVVYWPWSVIVWAFSDLVRQIYEFIYSFLNRFLQSISDRIWRKVTKDFGKR
jgi:hypothetical protein